MDGVVVEVVVSLRVEASFIEVSVFILGGDYVLLLYYNYI